VNNDSTEDIQFVARDGTVHDVDLTGIETVEDFRERVADQTDGDITITITDGEKFTVTDNTGGAGKLKVLGAGPDGTATAEDLGILNEDGVSAASFDGEVIENADHTPVATTLQDVIDRINDATDDLGAPNAGRIVASIAPDGLRLRITDTTGGGSNLTIAGTASNPYAARDLGIEADVAAATVDGARLINGLNSSLVASLNGGAGLGGNTTLTITDRNGGTDTLTLSEDVSLSAIIDQINASAPIAVTASLNEAGNGLLITDTSGGSSNLIIAGNAAAELGIATGGGGVASSTVRGTDLELRYAAEGSLLSSLNYGRGIGTGSFRVTDGVGHQFTVTIGTNARSLYDVIAAINNAGDPDAEVLARVNDAGDGIVLENTLVPPAGIIKVESLSGTTARDLNILGQASADGEDLDGSYEISIGVNASDTVEEIMEAINDEGAPVGASIINSGGGPAPYQLVFSSEIAGIRGDILVDDAGFGLDLVTLTEARDAKVFFGSGDPATATLIQRSTNTISNVLPGVTMSLLDASDDPVTLTITRDTAAIEERIAGFVTAFNDAVGRIDQYDFFDVETEERGPLLGNPTTARVRAALFRTLQQRATGVDTQYKYLSQVGITVASGGEAIEFNRAKFRTAYETDPEAVENLFTAFEGTSNGTEEIEDGVTVTRTGQTYTVLGFGDLFDQLLDGITNSIDGSFTLADEAFQGQIDITNSRIEALDVRLAARRARLEQQFAAMETALARIQAQQGAVLSLAGNLSLSQSLLSGQ
jgi:flagellar hook-associated protein 2